ncbi:MAG: threonine/homoserine/homoserine lactone efflux protein [Parasphingorhabdus sp.]|jgi:threonine/homoserine/homoserine lactone efflux protein
MPTLEIFLGFLLATLLMNISPGPSNLYVMARAISHGFKGGLVAALGLATGSLFYVFATALGLSVLFKHSPQIYLIVKLVGATYLIYLGYRYIRPKPASMHQPTNSHTKKPLASVF